MQRPRVAVLRPTVGVMSWPRAWSEVAGRLTMLFRAEARPALVWSRWKTARPHVKTKGDVGMGRWRMGRRTVAAAVAMAVAVGVLGGSSTLFVRLGLRPRRLARR
jgi:hypothetical protein